MIDKLSETKSLNSELPKPVAFSSWKHHLGYVHNFLKKQNYPSPNDSFIREIPQFIGNSNIDFYSGSLDVVSISNEILRILDSEKINSINDYINWITSDGLDYRCAVLSDGSNWTLRLGQSENRYVHIHPSRHSKKTVRVKSSTLKTVYAFLLYYGLSDTQISVEKVNFVRNKFVKLPPLKMTSTLAAVSRMLSLFVA
jgi:hypothetical protein